MNKQDKELLKAHKEALEGIQAFNKSMHEALDTIKDYIGV